MDIELVMRSTEANGLANRVFLVPDEKEAIACLLSEAKRTRSREEKEQSEEPAILADAANQE